MQSKVHLSERDFSRFSGLVYEQCGIKMSPAKKTMLEGRLLKRLRALGLRSFEAYHDYLMSAEGMAAESVHMIDAITTNKTDFFREPAHFDYLVRTILPEYIQRHGLGAGGRLNLWSAGCSTGEEPYTLAMVLSEFADRFQGFRFQILASDISTRVLDRAKRGIYEHERIEPVPIPLRKKYLMRGKENRSGLVRVTPELRARVRFQRVNFMEANYGIRERLNVIFCRNVLIYFDRPTQERVVSKLCAYLVPGGYLFTGHSETLQGLHLPLGNVAATIYRKL